MMPRCGWLPALKRFIGDTWNSWGVESARVKPGTGNWIKLGLAVGWTVLFFLNSSLVLNLMTTGSGDCSRSLLVLLLPLLLWSTWPLSLVTRTVSCSFFSSISLFSTSLISFWMRIKPSCDGFCVKWGEKKKKNLLIIFLHYNIIWKVYVWTGVYRHVRSDENDILEAYQVERKNKISVLFRE